MAVSRARTARAEPKAAEDYDDLRELEGALAIDQHALDEALVAQPEHFYRVSKAYAMEVSRRDAAKQALQDEESLADLSIREKARDEELKITEGEVRAKVQTAQRVVVARDRLSALSESVGKLAALKEAFGQRSYALKDLVGLFLANYYTASEHTSAGAALRGQAADANRARMNDARRGR